MRVNKIMISNSPYHYLTKLGVWTDTGSQFGYIFSPAIKFIQMAVKNKIDIQLELKNGFFSFKFHIVQDLLHFGHGDWRIGDWALIPSKPGKSF